MIARRSYLRRKTWLRPVGKSKYRRRLRNRAHMDQVRTMPCVMRIYHGTCTPCQGRIEADHAGDRPFGQRSSDETTIPMCSAHHRERTDYRGSFAGFTAERMREFRMWAIRETGVHLAEASRIAQALRL